MAILKGFFDETGHSQDQRQLFNGMAGLLAPVDKWESFETGWLATLKTFNLPYFHMTEFANSRGVFHGWANDEKRRRALLGELWSHLESAAVMPVGLSISMTAFRRLPRDRQELFGDPYLLGFLCVVGYSVGFMELIGLAPSERLDLIFSAQTEFMNAAKSLYQSTTTSAGESPAVLEAKALCKDRTLPPKFCDMRTAAGLQAADMVAYEVYKEHERITGCRKAVEPRYGFERLVRLSERLGYSPLVKFFSEVEIDEFVADILAEKERNAY